MIWHGNEYADNSVAQTLDATLFQHNMRGWAEMQRLMLVNKKAFKFFYMNTASGHRGFMMVCKQCDQLVKVRWLKNDPWDSEALETCRSMIRPSSLGILTLRAGCDALEYKAVAVAIADGRHTSITLSGRMPISNVKWIYYIKPLKAL